MSNEILEFECTIQHQTADAWKVYIVDEDAEYWFPKSQVEIEFNPGDTDTIFIPEWLALDIGIL